MLVHPGLDSLQSPHDIGSYFGGLSADVHDGTTPSTQLKLSPAQRSVLDALQRRLCLTKEERH